MVFHQISFIRNPFFTHKLVLLLPKEFVNLIKGITFFGSSLSFNKETSFKFILFLWIEMFYDLLLMNLGRFNSSFRLFIFDLFGLIITF